MSSSYFPQQPPLAPEQQFVLLPPPPPYTAYQPSCPPQQQSQQYQQHEAQGFSTEYYANAPPTPVYTPSPFPQSNSQPQGFPSSAAQYFPPPPQSRPNFQQPGNGSQPAFNQPPANAPPTPAFTPAPYGSPGHNSGDPNDQASSTPTAQYFPSPLQNQHLQQPIGSGSQPYNQPPSNAPPTPAFTPAPYDSQGPRPGESTAQYFPPPPQNLPNQPQQQQQPPPPTYNQPANAPPITAFSGSYGNTGTNPGESNVLTTQYFPPPPQVQPTLQQPPIANNSQPGCYQPPANSFPHPPQEQSHANIVQSPQNGYPAERQQFPQIQSQYPPPIVYSQAPQVLQVQSTYTQSTVNIQSNPLSPPHSTSQLYSGPGGFQTSYPPEKVQYQQQIQNQQQPQIILVGQQQGLGNPLVLQTQQNVNPALPPVSGFIPPGASAVTPAKDDLKSSKTKRFFGDTLVGRAARSSVSTVTSTVKLPASLSPWGDNNPVTLPNVRYRDAALFATFHVIGGPLVDGVGNLVTDAFGADTFVSEIVSSGAGFINGNTIVKYGVFQIVEQAIDKGVLEKVLPEVEKTMRTTSAKSLQVAIKHKLMGVEADLRFVGAYPTTSLTACDKGWFCPYLYASSREPVISRAQDFSIAQFFGPYVTADTALTHRLLTESASVIPLCDPNPTLRVSHSRLLVLFTGITPLRAGMWSTSRRPGCAQLIFHLLDGCPALVLPVRTAHTPILAWSPWTLSQMQNSQNSSSGSSAYKPETHHRQITDWLMQLVEREGLYPCVRDTQGAFERLMGKVVTMIINGARAVPRCGEKLVFGKLDAERAGVVMLRY